MIIRDGTTFAARAVTGFALAHPAIVRRVENGVIARAQPDETAPLFVIGGGSGHFPAFTGFVGEGLAAAAVHGDIFASPSEVAITGVVRAARPSGDVILGYGNYAGDRLNFSAAANRLRDDGYRVHELIVTDDIASSPEHAERRGIAGNVVVFKVCGAAIAEGRPLDSVVGIAERANAGTRTLGVALSGCTIPGSRNPLFTVGEDTVAIGLGIHGEPGIESRGSLTETELAELLVDRTVGELLASPSRRFAVLLNGMGAVNAEALHSLWPVIHARLRLHGCTAVAPLVGAYVSSLDMDGLSLSLCALDPELEALWLAPARSGALDRRAGDVTLVDDVLAPAASERADTMATGIVGKAFQAIVAVLAQAETQLGELDAVAGDGDHGRGMLAGARAALDATSGIEDPKAALHAAGTGWAARAGGTSGALWGAMLVAASDALIPDAPIEDQVRSAVAAAHRELVRRGGAQPGDKTMLDAIEPFANRIAESGDIHDAWIAAARMAQAAADATRNLVPRRGRSRSHPGRSAGHPDPGAVSFALVVDALAPSFDKGEG